MRELNENPCAVAGVHFATASASVIEVNQDGQRLLNNIMGTFPLHLTDEADATGIVFKLRVVEALFFG